MKKLIILLSLLTTQCYGITIIKISQFPNTNNPSTNWLIVLASTGDTNYNMTLSDFSTWLATNSFFTSSLLNNINIPFGSPQTNFTTQTYSPNAIWTNTVAWWSTNANFTSVSIYNPGPVFNARLVITNSAASSITNTLAFTAYSYSLGTNITKTIIPSGSILDMQFDYYNGTYYIKDYGKNNSTLYQLATNAINGTLHVTNGVLFIY